MRMFAGSIKLPVDVWLPAKVASTHYHGCIAVRCIPFDASARALRWMKDTKHVQRCAGVDCGKQIRTVGSGGFRQVQRVWPNRGHRKRGPHRRARECRRAAQHFWPVGSGSACGIAKSGVYDSGGL